MGFKAEKERLGLEHEQQGKRKGKGRRLETLYILKTVKNLKDWGKHFWEL